MYPITTGVDDRGAGHFQFCSGILRRAMNTLGQLGGAIAPVVIGYIVKWTNYNWSIAFYVSAAVYCGGILCWSFLDPVTPLDPER